MKTFIQVLILLLLNCVGSLSAQSPISVTVTVGSTAVLPCDWRNIIPEWKDSSEIVWQISSRSVFERSSTGSYEGSGYEGRVDVPEDELKKGNCSLLLKNVRPEDAVLYESLAVVKSSYIYKSIPIQNVELTVNHHHTENPPVSSDSGQYTTIIAVVCTVCLLLIIIGVYVLYRMKVKRYRRANAGDQEDNM